MNEAEQHVEYVVQEAARVTLHRTAKKKQAAKDSHERVAVFHEESYDAEDDLDQPDSLTKFL